MIPLMKPDTSNMTPQENTLHVIRQSLLHWKQNWQTRQQLASLNEDELKDVGLTESQRQEELNKFFWER